jgi:hypothetical protein
MIHQRLSVDYKTRIRVAQAARCHPKSVERYLRGKRTSPLYRHAIQEAMRFLGVQDTRPAAEGGAK